MNNVDTELRDDNIAIRNRPIEAWYRFGSGSMPSSDEIPSPNSYSGHDLSIRIFRWFTQRYGNRLNVDFTWKMAIEIRGDIFQLKLPLIMGTRKVNVLNLIENLTTDYANSLSQYEVNKLIENMQLGFKARHSLEGRYEILLIKQAIGDIEVCVSHLIAQSPQFGLSKWSSLQATEKLLKAFIQNENKNFPKTHNLQQLNTLAESHGLKPIPNNLINYVQCNASVRYGDTPVNLIEAIQAHHDSLAICSGIAEQIST